jgi:glucose/arabinose dehydrogenase
MSRIRAAFAIAAVATLACACTAATGQTAPTWVPKPSFQGDGGPNLAVPDLPTPQNPQPSGGQTPSTAPTSPGSSATPAQDPAVVAKHLTSPVGLAVLPDGTAIVGERLSGKILRVQPTPDQPVRTLRTLPGVVATGDGGLLDLALSPHYDQDNLIYAYVTTATDNRVVDFTLTGAVTPVLTGIPKGATGNAGRIAFGADGDLYVATGDAGVNAPAGTSLAGKVLRVTDIGRPAPGNPTHGSAIYTAGHHDIAGLCAVSGTPVMLDVEGPAANGYYGVNALTGGNDYGWPSIGTHFTGPIVELPNGQGEPGGCTVLDNVLYVTSLQGKLLLSTALSGNTAASISTDTFGTLLNGKYGRLRTVVAATDGALWLTTSNRDGHGTPTSDDERVLRIIPSGGGAKLPV